SAWLDGLGRQPRLMFTALNEARRGQPPVASRPVSKRVHDHGLRTGHLPGHLVMVIMHGALDQVMHKHGGIAAYLQKAADAPHVFATERRFGYAPKEACLKDGRAEQVGRSRLQ